jgi:uncharacterized protein (TIGR00251 family)
MSVSDSEYSYSFTVRVVPRASRSEVVGIHDGVLKLRIASAPVDGAANREVITILAKHFGVSKSDISIVSGETSKNKRIKIANLSESSYEAKINEK